LDACVATEAVASLEHLADHIADSREPSAREELEAVLLRVVDGPWPFPPHFQLAPQPLAALDLLEYPDPAARHLGREVLRGLTDVVPATVARRTAPRPRRGRAANKMMRG
jgi:hypothetical protein